MKLLLALVGSGLLCGVTACGPSHPSEDASPSGRLAQMLESGALSVDRRRAEKVEFLLNEREAPPDREIRRIDLNRRSARLGQILKRRALEDLVVVVQDRELGSIEERREKAKPVSGSQDFPQ